MKIRGYCTFHKRWLGSITGRIVFPTTLGDPPAQDENGWMDLDTSEMDCPKFEEYPCNGEWVWQIES